MRTRTLVEFSDNLAPDPVVWIVRQRLNQLPCRVGGALVEQEQSPCNLKPNDGQAVLRKNAQIRNNGLDIETGIGEERKQPFYGFDPSRQGTPAAIVVFV